MTNCWCLLLAAVVGTLFVISSATDENDCKELFPSDGPQMTPCKKEIILQNGQNFTIKCQANTPIEFIQQEPAEDKLYDIPSVTQRNSTNNTTEYEAYLELTNVSRDEIGFYACVRKDVMIDRDEINQLVTEPNNTADISYIYIYVNGTSSLFAPMRELVMAKKGFYVAECKPSTPDVEVDIILKNKTLKKKNYSSKIGFVMEQCVATRAYKCEAKIGNKIESKSIRAWKNEFNQSPNVSAEYKEFLPGETFTLNCSAYYTRNAAVRLKWKLPNDSLKVIEYNNNNDVMSDYGSIIQRSITIVNATKEHEGIYTCSATNNCGNEYVASVYKQFLEKPYLNYTLFDKTFLKETKQAISSFNIVIRSYPPVQCTFYKDGIQIENNKTFSISTNPKKNPNSVTLRISRRSVEDSGNYTLNVTNGYQNQSFTYDIRFKVKPTVKFEQFDKTCVLNQMTSLQCKATGYPLPDVKWIFNNDTARKSTEVKIEKIYDEIAYLKVPCQTSGNISCSATNEMGTYYSSRRLLVYELPNGFGIKNQPEGKIMRFPQNQMASVQCVASIFHYTNVTWEKNGAIVDMVDYPENNQFSLVAKLKINSSFLNSGRYECHGIKNDGKSTYDFTNIEILGLEAPQIDFKTNTDGSVQIYEKINMFCQAQGVPRPEIQWFKDNKEIVPRNDSASLIYNVDYRTVGSNITIERLSEEDLGQYECVAYNTEGEERYSITLTLKEEAYVKYVIVAAVIVVILVILLIYLTCKVRKEKRFRKELAAAGLLYFNEGVTKSLNPDLGIDEQAELLPYNEKFEFPADKLALGKQLGAGAFGVVYKAQARGIINAEEETTVAVKMVKKTADNMYIKALASELKIMVHLGKHINIVNLLGACTKNVGKRELVVIVEFCKFGNIHNYMQRHREVFIDQFSDMNKEKGFGKVNRGYDSSGSTGLQSDYGTANTQDTDHTFLTNNTQRTSRKNVPNQPTEVKASEGYVQPEWRSNYECDYSYDGRMPRPLTTRDLLAWAFQIARGMEYLASRKVLHGDLAARNILLAEDNIVKICDFGLARSIYKNDEYQKTENSLLPVKWLAIECMTDRIFSTQSDVWSFGIVLWELFTLAKTPYPNMSPAHLLQFLREGHRLEKPVYADDRVYNLMKRCWEEKPTTRPSFTQLQETLGTFLEDNVRNHYVDLNSAYMEGNTRPEGQEDYLAMMSAPDYNNMVTPSPHHYVNEVGDQRRFFPPSPTTKIDDDGYLQMSPANIFSPKSTGTKFDFDSRKFNSRPSEASSGGSELTPMLTLNNLPRSGSDSDHEGNPSPHPNVCPRIEEEPDEVFDSKQTKKPVNQNAKNALITDATNPMYITCTFDSEVKKPIDNSYVNIVPNGLVK